MRLLKATLLAAGLALTLSTAGLADPRTDADAAYGRGDFAAGVAIDRVSAANGDVRAMINLGDAYATGRGVVEDPVEAMQWYVKAAEAGSDLTGPVLGSPRADSEEASGVSFNREVALTIKAGNDLWFPVIAAPGPGDDIYNRAARARHAGDADAGELAPQLTEAVNAGSVQAAVSLARLYEREIQNPTEALRLYEAAAERGRPDAMERLAGMYFGAALNENGLRWLRAAVEAGNLDATAYLAQRHEFGELVPRNPREAFRLNLIAAEKGRTWSALHVAEAYHDGHGVERDFAKAARWFQVAADDPKFSMNFFAKYGLAFMYLDGRGVPQDIARALQLLRESSAGRDAEAMELLGTLELLAMGTPANAEAAARHFNASAEFGRTVGLYNLGVIYSQGLAGPADPALAATWWNKAATGGDEHARARLNGTPTPHIAPDDLLLPDQVRNGFTAARCIRTASARGISPYNGPPDATLELAAPIRIEEGMAVLDLRVSGTDPDGDALSYRFKFGNDEYSDLGTQVTLRTEPADSYFVTAIADDGKGCAMHRWMTFTMPEPPRPTPAPAKASEVVLESDPPGVRCSRSGPQGEARADTGQRNRAAPVTIEEVSSSLTPEGTLLTIRAVAADPDNDPLQYTYTALDGRIAGTGPTVTWLVNGAGFHMIMVEVWDGHGCTSFGSYSKNTE